MPSVFFFPESESEAADNLPSTSLILRLFFWFSEKMTAMAKSSKSDLGFASVVGKKNTEALLILDHGNGFQCRTESDSFFISMPSPANTSIKEDIANSRTPTSIGRNGFLSSSLKKITSKLAGDSLPPKENPLCINRPEKSPDITVGQKHHAQANQQVHHQITITTGNTSNPITGSGTSAKRSSPRSSSFKRTALKFLLKPRNVVIFFASISSAGSILLLFGIMINNNVFNNEEVYYY